MSDPLEEIRILKKLASTLGLRAPENQEQEPDHPVSEIPGQKPGKDDLEDSNEVKVAQKIVTSILARHGVKHGTAQRKKSDEGLLLRYPVTLSGKRYWLKMYLIYETGHFSLVLWDHGHQKLLDVIAIGFLKDKYRLRAIGKQRLARWVENGNSGSE